MAPNTRPMDSSGPTTSGEISVIGQITDLLTTLWNTGQTQAVMDFYQGLSQFQNGQISNVGFEGHWAHPRVVTGSVNKTPAL